MVWQTAPGSGNLTIDGNFQTLSGNNILMGVSANVRSGQGVFAFGNVTTAPVSLAGVGGVLYAQSGHLRYIGQLGTLTTIASA